MNTLYTCEDCYKKPAIVKVSGVFTCYECWSLWFRNLKVSKLNTSQNKESI